MPLMQQLGERQGSSRSDERAEGRQHKAKTKICKFYREGTCMRGSGCFYAHGEDELQRSGHRQQQGSRDWDVLGQQRQMQPSFASGDASDQQSNLPTAAQGYGAAVQVVDGSSSFEQIVHNIPAQSGDRFFAPSTQMMQQWQHQQHQQEQQQQQHQQQLPSPSSVQQSQMQALQNLFLVNEPATTQWPQQYEQQHQLHQTSQQWPQPWIQNSPHQLGAPLIVGPNGFMAACMVVPMPPTVVAPGNGIQGFVPQMPIQTQSTGQLQTTNEAHVPSLDGFDCPINSAVPERFLPQTQLEVPQRQTTNRAQVPMLESDFDFPLDSSVPRRFLPRTQLELPQRLMPPTQVEQRAARNLGVRSTGRQHNRQTRARQLDAEERNSRLLEFLSVCPIFEPQQAITLLEASDWDVNDAFMAAAMRGQRARRRRTAYDADVEEAIRRSMIDEHYSGGFAAKGLTVEEIADSTTTTTYRRASSEGELQDECAICLTAFEEGDELRVLTCQHSFHIGCIDQWLPLSGQCAVCKQSVVDGNNSK